MNDIFIFFVYYIYCVRIRSRLSIQLQCLLQYIKNISNDKLNSTFDRGIDGIAALLGVINNGFIRLRFSFLAASNLLRCGSAKSVAEGKIPRFKVLSCRQGSVWLRACYK
ncbi:Hypothetical_protein [Hexamita inflata]|uniref:Hypothetical_protein n=1 Tax=Hexamita inflata TaxID=28002 RepID=A0AA86R7D6_9EUKA|nr:Hypothetical protein HINF_LOCUS8904 [Hexamita inflata]CAI9967472.1 Hypothetical protein HINF_LOCUS55117 [Hexamita inflata]